jgi:mannose-6-phosphate isomerase-like protein (cupin superfamily)
VQFIRPFDDANAFDTGFPGYRAQVLSHLESAVMINSHIEKGGCGPGLHYHHVDQLYFLLRGQMTLQLGTTERNIDAGTLVIIPAGLPHRNWNDGPGSETHFEMIIPAPSPLAPIAHFVDTVDDVPAQWRTDLPGQVERVAAERMLNPLPGFRLQQLMDSSSGVDSAVVMYAEVEPGGAGPGTHVHEFDQYYLVLEGELTIEVALQKHTAGPDTLVVLPAGVPHCQYNSSQQTEKHLTINTPAPLPDAPWDVGVDFTANGITHGGALLSNTSATK